MSKTLPVGKLDISFLSDLLESYTTTDESVAIGARVGEDAAVLDMGDRFLVAKTNPITFATDEIGWYVVNVCVNNMVVRGVRPRWMLNCILLPEDKTTPQMVEEIFRQIYEASRQVGVLIIGGHTEVTYGLDRPIVTGFLIGEIDREHLIATGGAKVGDTIMVTKALGVEGTAIIAREMADDLIQKGCSVDFIERAQNFLYDPGIGVFQDALTAAETGLIHCMTDATEGGLATALHEMAEAAEVGVLVEAENVPVLPETAQICAEYGIDPMGLIASGMLIMTAAPDSVGEIRRRMLKINIDCTPIGTVTARSAGCRLSKAGVESDLPYYATDELTRVL
jgi:hydrogenase expression/formation protein HypE